jgi:hypothetical protein
MQMLDVLAGSSSYTRIIILVVFGCFLLQFEYLVILAPIKKNYLENKKFYSAHLSGFARLRAENRQYLQVLRLNHDFGKRFYPKLDRNTLLVRLIKGSKCDFTSAKRVKSGFQFSGHGEFEEALVLLKKLEGIHAFLQSIMFKKIHINDTPVIYLQVQAG